MENPTSPAALLGEAQALYYAGRYAEALARYDQVLALKPSNAPLHANRGAALLKLGQLEAALLAAETALGLVPDLGEAQIIRGEALYLLGRFDVALESFDKAVALSSQAAAYAGRGNALLSLKRFSAAVESYDAALALKPTLPFIRGPRLFAKLNICAWDGIEAEIAAVAAAIEQGQIPSAPFSLLAMLDSPLLQRLLTERFADTQYPLRNDLGPLPARPTLGKIRVGYFSADFYDHPVPRLMAGVFERHDRALVETVAFSYGPPVAGALRSRLEAAFGRFIDVRGLEDKEIAAAARLEEIDVAVDLTGHCANGRPGIFAHRAAPIQVNYLGFPGTLGAPYVDYIIADDVVIPEAAKGFYAEKVVNLPGSYQCNDRKRAVSKRVFTRAEAGLPETGFVFCCFNNNFKILPGIFAIWARIMNAVPGSVLWLIEDNPAAGANLKRNAPAFGLDPARLIFAPRMALDEHLARHKLADLVLDTLPYNAHTTASDSLWVGVPLVTCPGESFQARVAASLLTAVGLPELITPTLKVYEALAITLARDPARLQALKDKLIAARDTAPLFDTDASTRALEAAYARMRDSDLAAP